MKDYIDLTQLPAEKIEAMVLALSKNDFELLRKYCDELGILYGYPMEEVVNIFSDQLLLSKKTLMKAVDQMDPGYLASQVDKIEETLPSKADLSALEPIQQRVSTISNENSDINDRLEDIEKAISTLTTSTSGEITTINGKIDTISATHDNLAGSVNNLWSDLSNASSKLDTIQEGAEKNTISAIQLNGNSIRPINKTVNLANVVVNDSLNRAISELNASFDTKLKTLKAETDGATGALTQNVGDINNTLDSKLDISVAKQISGDLSTNIKNLSDEVEKTTTVFESQFASTNAAVEANKVNIANLITADKDISDQIKLTSADLVGFINGRVDHLDDELVKKVPVGEYKFTVERLDEKDGELSKKLTEQESHIDALKSDVDTNSRELSNKISAIYVTTTNSTLRPNENGVISIDVATTSIINAQITAMADVFHATVDELIEHLDEDLNVVSAALDAKTYMSAFNPVAADVNELKNTSIPVITTQINNLSDNIISVRHGCEHSHLELHNLIDCLSSSLDTERNDRLTNDATLRVLIDDEGKARIDADDKERDERVKGDKDLDRKIDTLTEKLLHEYDELRTTHTTDVSKLKAAITDTYDTLTKSISDEANKRIEKDQELKDSIVELEKTVIKCETIVKENNAEYQKHTDQIYDLNTRSSANSENINTLSTRLQEHANAGSERFNNINIALTKLSDIINGTPQGGDGLADRIDHVEYNIKNLTTVVTTADASIQSDLKELADSITADGGLKTQVTNVTGRVDQHAGIISKNSADIALLRADIVEKDGINDKIDELSTIIGGDGTIDNIGLSGVIDNLITVIGGCSIGSQESISKRLDDINNDLSGNRDDNQNIFGVYDRIEDIEDKLSGNSDEKGICERLTDLEQAKLITSKTISDIQDDIGGIQTNIGGIQTKTDDLSEKVETIISNITNEGGINDKIGDLSTKICGNGTADNTGLIGVVDNLLSVIGPGAFDANVSSINERINSISSDLAGDSSTGVVGVIDRIGDLEKALTGGGVDGEPGINSRIVSCNSRIDSCETRLSVCEDNISILKGNISQQGNDINAIKSQCKEIQTAGADLAKMTVDASDPESLVSKLSETSDKVTAAECNLATAQGNISDLEGVVSELKGYVISAYEAIFGSTDDIYDGIDGDIRSLSDDIISISSVLSTKLDAGVLENYVVLSDFNNSIAEIGRDVTEITKDIANLSSAFDDHTALIDTLATAAEASDSRIAILEDAVKNIDVGMINKRLTSAENELSTHLSFFDALEISINGIVSTADSLASTVNTISGDVRSLSSRVNDIATDLENLDGISKQDIANEIEKVSTTSTNDIPFTNLSDKNTIEDVVTRVNQIITILNNLAENNNSKN